MKKILRRILIPVIAFLLIGSVCLALVLQGASSAKTIADKGSKELIDFSASFPEITDEVLAQGRYLAADNETLELYIYPDASVSVVDKRTGKEYATTVKDGGTDFTNDSEEAQAAFLLEYLNASSRKETMNSTTQSVEKSQYRVYRAEDRIRVEYILGSNLAEEFYPKIVSKQRFEEMILSKAAESDREFLLRNYFLMRLSEVEDEQEKNNLLIQYPSLNRQDIYVLSDSVNQRIKQRITSILKEVNYTYQDYLYDNEDNEIQSDDMGLTFLIAVDYRLEEDGVSVTIPKDSIRFYGEHPITTLSPFPYLIGVSGEGVLFIPSGSGAVVDLQAGGQTGSCTIPVYGADNSIKGQTDAVKAEPDRAVLPVFGKYNGDSGILAIIESGEQNANLNLMRMDSAAYIYPEFTITQNDVARLTGSAVSYTCGSDILADDISIRYVFFQEESGVDYNDFAAYYREYLKSKGTFPKEKPAESDPLLAIEMIGQADIEETFLSTFAIRHSAVLSTFSEMADMAQELSAIGGDNLYLRINGWNKGGIYSQTPARFERSSALGGKKEYQALLSTLEQLSVKAAPVLTMTYCYNPKPFDGYAENRFSARFVNKSVAKLMQVSPIDGSDMETQPESQIVSPSQYQELTRKYTETDAFQSGYIDIGRFGYDINSDFNAENYYDRSRAKKEIEKSLGVFQPLGKIAMENANAYMLAYPSILYGVEPTSSGHKIFSASIPFQQMVLHGYLNYSVPSASLLSDADSLLLDCIETGSGVHFSMIKNQAETLEGSGFSWLNLLEYERVAEMVRNVYPRLRTALQGLNDVEIKRYEQKGEGVSVTEYANGTKIAVNRTSKDVQVDGVLVKAKNYIRYEKG